MHSGQGTEEVYPMSVGPVDFQTHTIFTKYLPPATKLGQGNIFRSVCQEFCPQGKLGMCGGGSMHAGGHAWQGGMHGEGACVAGGHAWWGGMHGRGTCMAGEGVCMADTTRYGQ